MTRPNGMTPVARRVWDQNAAEMIEAGRLTTWSREMFRMYCEDVSRSEAAQEDINRDGTTITGVRGGPVTNPAIRVQREAEASAMRIARTLGLLPSERGVLAKRTPSMHDHDAGTVPERLTHDYLNWDGHGWTCGGEGTCDWDWSDGGGVTPPGPKMWEYTGPTDDESMRAAGFRKTAGGSWTLRQPARPDGD